MSYYRPRVPSWLWVTLAITAGLFAVVVMGRATLDSVRFAERQRVYAEAHQWASATLTVQREQFARERDSLRAETGRRDTVLDVRITRVRDTTWLPADTSPVVRLQACRVELDALASECDAFRATATQALAAGDSVHRADSLRTVALIMGRVAVSDSLRRAERTIDRRPTWGTVAKSGVAGAGLGALLCLIYCR